MTHPVLVAVPVLAMVLFAALPASAAESRQKQFTDCDAKAKELLSRMTLDEKIGQMIQPDQGSLKDPADVEKYFLGSLLSGGGSGPKNKDDYTLKGWTDLVDGYQKHALKTRLAIPLLYGIDAVHGHNNVPGAVDLSARHRPRLHARRRPRGKGGARHGGGSPRHRHQLGLRPVRGRPAGRALGPDV